MKISYFKSDFQRLIHMLNTKHADIMKKILKLSYAHKDIKNKLDITINQSNPFYSPFSFTKGWAF